MKLGLFFVCIMIVLAGCATEKRVMRVDGSSQEATNSSLKQMSESLSAYDRCRLQAAVLRIQIGDTSSWTAGSNAQKSSSDPLGTMLNGMNFQQIIDLSERYPDKAGSTCNK